MPDPNGRRLLVMPWADPTAIQPVPLARPAAHRVALCSAGRRLGIRFEGQQPERAHNGRQSPRNFDLLAGSVFTVLDGQLDPMATCLVAADDLLMGSTVWNLARPDTAAPCADRKRFEDLRRRRVINCWPLARGGRAQEVLLLEFERRGTEALASVAVLDGDRTRFADSAATVTADPTSLWRVDDGGVLSPEGLDVVCVVQRGNWMALGTSWAGAEGRLLTLWSAQGNGAFTKAISDYWYQAPLYNLPRED